MRIYTASPKPFLTKDESDDSFFSRDMGLTCHALRSVGVDSKVVLLNADNVKQHPDIIRVSLKDMESSEWWKCQQLDGVVLGAWADPCYTPIAKAIHESGTFLIVRCDSGRPFSQWQQSLWMSLWANYINFLPRMENPLVSAGASMIKTLFYYVPQFYTNKAIGHMSYADCILNETPIGARKLKELLCSKGISSLASRVLYMVHPTCLRQEPIGDLGKCNRIIAVGRWSSYSKNAPLLSQTLIQLLRGNPEWHAHIYGSGMEDLETLVQSADADIKDRIVLKGRVSNEELMADYSASKIYFMPSRLEGSSVAATEALGCGCSVVGGKHLLCMQNFASKNSGTLARQYSVSGMFEALQVEIAAWNSALRQSDEIRGVWLNESCSMNIARRIKDIIDSSLVANGVLGCCVDADGTRLEVLGL